jgi:UTP--glucose-1-phosphate uridylyltransferase
VTKAVVPAAGLGTGSCQRPRRRPRKCCLSSTSPRFSMSSRRPSDCGLNDVLLITGRSKRSIEDHFDRAYELEEALTAKEDWDKLAQVRESSELATMHYVRQGDPKGLGHAVLCAAQHVGHEPFAVLLGDDLIDPKDPLLTRMIDIRNQFGGSVVALMEVAPRRSRCTAARRSSRPARRRGHDHRPGREAVPGTAPSRWIVIGRYVCDPEVFDVLRETRPAGAGRSSSPTRSRCSPAKGELRGVLFSGRRFDTGNKLDYLRTMVMFAAERPDLAGGVHPLAAQVPRRAASDERGTVTGSHTEVARHPGDSSLSSVEAYQSAILSTIRPLAPTSSSSDAEGCVLAEDVTAAVARCRRSTTRHGRLRGQGRRRRGRVRGEPGHLRVTGEIAAGDTGAYRLVPGTAIRIMTGAQLPAGADAVVPVEWTDGGIARVRSTGGRRTSGTRCGYAGGDAAAGETLLTAGHQACGRCRSRWRVGRGGRRSGPARPRVVVLSTGDELAEPGTPLVPGRIWDSNSYMLAAAAREAGASPTGIGRARRPGGRAARARGAAHPGRPADHHRRGQHGRRARRGQGGAARARHRHLPQGGHAAGDAAGLRRDRRRTGCRSSPCPATRSAPTCRSSSSSGPRSPRCRAPTTGPATQADADRRPCARRRPALLPARRARRRKVTPLSGQGSHQIATLGRANALIIVPEWEVQLAGGRHGRLCSMLP